jgi:hypothetical protein
MALIDPDIARAQLKERRPVNESCGLNGPNTNLDHGVSLKRDVSTVAENAPVPRGAAPPDSDESAGTVEARIKAEKLRHSAT